MLKQKNSVSHGENSSKHNSNSKFIKEVFFYFVFFGCVIRQV